MAGDLWPSVALLMSVSLYGRRSDIELVVLLVLLHSMATILCCGVDVLELYSYISMAECCVMWFCTLWLHIYGNSFVFYCVVDVIALYGCISIDNCRVPGLF